MLPGLADVLNASIELAAAFFISLSVSKLYHDKKVRGISWWQIAFFTGLGFWNLAYFTAMHSPWSFWAGVVITAVNGTYLAMLLYYTWLEGHGGGFHVEKDERMFIETYSGRKFYVLHPDPAEVDPIDIAQAIGNICRYLGHTTQFFSVAEHCCLLADWCLAQGWGPERAFAALTHDAGEAYTGDQPRPWKAALPMLKELDKMIDAVVLPAIGSTAVKPAWLDEIDARIIMDERKQARTPSGNKWMTDDLEPLGVTLKFWTPAQARNEWLLRYGTLRAEMGVPHAQ